MKRLSYVASLVALVVVLGGCAAMSAHRPGFQSAGIFPSALKPGDSALITAEMNDYFNLVRQIKGVVKEDPRIVFELRDDGLEGDSIAHDGVWTLRVFVPFQAPPGEYELELTAYDDNDNPVLVKGNSGETAPLSSTFHLVIEYPQG